MAGCSYSLAKPAYFVVVVAAALLIGGWVAKAMYETQPSPAGAQNLPLQSPGRQVVHLYFADVHERHLVAEQRVVLQSGDDVALSRRLIELLVQGPMQGGSRTLPAGAKLRALFISSGTAVLDFEAEAFAEHPGGTAAELLSIYSVVNTLVLNIDSIRSVKFLIGGREAATLVGHVDLQDAFEVDMLWVR